MVRLGINCLTVLPKLGCPTNITTCSNIFYTHNFKSLCFVLISVVKILFFLLLLKNINKILTIIIYISYTDQPLWLNQNKMLIIGIYLGKRGNFKIKFHEFGQHQTLLPFFTLYFKTKIFSDS